MQHGDALKFLPLDGDAAARVVPSSCDEWQVPLCQRATVGTGEPTLARAAPGFYTDQPCGCGQDTVGTPSPSDGGNGGQDDVSESDAYDDMPELEEFDEFAAPT